MDPNTRKRLASVKRCLNNEFKTIPIKTDNTKKTKKTPFSLTKKDFERLLPNDDLQSRVLSTVTELICMDFMVYEQNSNTCNKCGKKDSMDIVFGTCLCNKENKDYPVLPIFTSPSGKFIIHVFFILIL